MEHIITDKKNPISIWSLFRDYWPSFQDVHWPKWSNLMREWSMKCMKDTTKCWSWALWFATYWCTCWKKTIINFTCKRKFCSRCSQPLSDKLINNVRVWLPTNIQYIHITFTLPEELRNFRLEYRHIGALNTIFQEAARTTRQYLMEKFSITPWIFSMIHTFWSHANRNPHIHLVSTLWWISVNSDKEKERINIKEKHLSFRSFKKRRRALIAKECRKILKKHDPKNYQKRNKIIEKLFKKSWYVTLSDPIIDVTKVVNYITRYICRPPISVAKIVDANLTKCPYESSITIKYTHKKPREERTVTYSIFDFIWMICRQLPDKYFKTIRFYWLFAHNKRKVTIPFIEEKTKSGNSPKIEKKPTNFKDRIRQTFGKNPFFCENCNCDMELLSITYFSKKLQSFTTNYFDSW